MEAKSTRRRWTYTEFARLPSEGNVRHEVIDGELVVTPAPSLRHQRVVGDLFALLHPFVRANELGELFVSPVDVLFAAGDYVQPDIVFVRADRTSLLTDRGIEGPPDLVVEVVSPSTAARDRGVKLERYRLYGVAECWLVDPDTCTVEVFRLSEGAAEAVVLGSAEVLAWSPGWGEATLGISVGELLG